ncbi:MAG: sigma-70 family RNA polymerase sigma factor [Phycisphaerales bacterium]|nr:sigma-70 family RNA polymerase sigma factor [Phycisphaerales bacterium]
MLDNLTMQEVEFLWLIRQLNAAQRDYLIEQLNSVVDPNNTQRQIASPQPRDDHVERAFKIERGWLRSRVRYLLHRSSLRATVSPDDVVQSVFLKAHAMADRLQWTTKEQTRSWLLITADRFLKQTAVTQNAIKRGGGRRAVPLDVLTSSMISMIDELKASDPTPSSQVGMREAADHLKSAIDKLPDNRREVMRLRYLEGKTEIEIAQQLGKSRGSIRSLIFNSLRNLWDGPLQKLYAAQ